MDIVFPKPKEGHEIHVFGEEQGFRGLPVRAGNEIIHLDGGQYLGCQVVTAWKPDADELARLNAGEAIYVSINTQRVAPMLLTVEPADEYDFRDALKERQG